MEPNTTVNSEPQMPIKTGDLASQGDALQNQSKSSFSKWLLIFAGLILLAILFSGVYFLGIYQGMNQKPTSKTPNTTFETSYSAKTITEWTTYTNNQYNFQLTYPKFTNGYFNSNYNKTVSGECGKYVKKEPNLPTGEDGIYFDSFFSIHIQPWNGSIEDYIAKQDNRATTDLKSKDLYTFTPILGSNTDQALEVSLKNGEAGVSDNSPLGNTFALYKKNNQLFILNTFQGEGDGCTFPWEQLPYTLNLEQHQKWWDITKNFKFTDQATQIDTASWKTFSNQYLSFKYPSDLKIVDPYPDTPDQSIYIGVIPSDKTLDGSAPPIVVTRIANPKNLDLQQWEAEKNAVSAQPSSYYKSTTEKTLIDNHTAYFNENANCEPYSCYQVFVMGKDNIFEFFNLDYGDYPPLGASSSQTYTRTEQNNLKTIFQEILDNVKFTQ